MISSTSSSPLTGRAAVDFTSYWSHSGRYRSAIEKLQKLIPVEGRCPNFRGKNKHLDRLRRAVNCYYDLYNNGLCNRASEFSRLFGFSAVQKYRSFDGRMIYCDELFGEVDAKMDEFVLAAAKEQDIDVVDCYETEWEKPIRSRAEYALNLAMIDVCEISHQRAFRKDYDATRFNGTIEIGNITFENGRLYIELVHTATNFTVEKLRIIQEKLNVQIAKCLNLTLNTEIVNQFPVLSE